MAHGGGATRPVAFADLPASRPAPDMARGIFVTGTDTGVGKTVASVALLRGLVACGRRAVGMKPVSAGIEAGADVNADVAALDEAGNVDAPLAERNPFAFVPAIAPHVAAARAGVAIDLDRIASAYARLAARADAVVVEGAGGPLVPIGAHHDMLDVAGRLRLPVVLVVGVRLGCLNHALAAELAIRARGLELAGWIANRIDPGMPAAAESVASLAQRLPAPCVADFAWGESVPPDARALARLGLA
ncbi:dethiobiotin synthetase [Burkholderiales bacterium]|nr:dethiobiotin synthetase [Burkholderiales bacterium]